MSIHFTHLTLLWLLPLAILPWLRTRQRALQYSSLDLLPPDPLADSLTVLLKTAGSIAILACISGASGPYRPESIRERVGHGAQIVVLLDRSRSMDLPFAGRASEATRIEGSGSAHDTKGKAARRLLASFAAKRPNDLIAMMEFTNVPVPVIGFTQNQQVIQGAIHAANIGRGLAQTDIGKGILAAVTYFEGQRYNGSRVILMVSDGGAHLDWNTQQRIAEELKREKVALYWLYLRSNRSPGLLADKDLAPENQDAVPEHFLHKYFQNIGIPYHAYEAENPEALQRAVQDVDHLESRPIRYTDELPRQELSRACFAVALACALLLLGAKMLELNRWR